MWTVWLCRPLQIQAQFLLRSSVTFNTASRPLPASGGSSAARSASWTP